MTCQGRRHSPKTPQHNAADNNATCPHKTWGQRHIEEATEHTTEHTREAGRGQGNRQDVQGTFAYFLFLQSISLTYSNLPSNPKSPCSQTRRMCPSIGTFYVFGKVLYLPPPRHKRRGQLGRVFCVCSSIIPSTKIGPLQGLF